MNGLLKKLAVLQNSFEVVAHNTKFKNDDPTAEKIGDVKICERFAKNIADIITAAKSTQEAIQDDLIIYIACVLDDEQTNTMDKIQTDLCQIVVDNFNQPKVIENEKSQNLQGGSKNDQKN
jgi:hypothetical protein